MIVHTTAARRSLDKEILTVTQAVNVKREPTKSYDQASLPIFSTLMLYREAPVYYFSTNKRYGRAFLCG